MVRVLGARQVLQAVVTGLAPTPSVLWLGAKIDATHAASMVGLAVFNRRYRRAALIDAAIAAAFTLVGSALAHTGPSRPVANSP